MYGLCILLICQSNDSIMACFGIMFLLCLGTIFSNFLFPLPIQISIYLMMYLIPFPFATYFLLLSSLRTPLIIFSHQTYFRVFFSLKGPPPVMVALLEPFNQVLPFRKWIAFVNPCQCLVSAEYRHLPITVLLHAFPDIIVSCRVSLKVIAQGQSRAVGCGLANSCWFRGHPSGFLICSRCSASHP